MQFREFWKTIVGFKQIILYIKKWFDWAERFGKIQIDKQMGKHIYIPRPALRRTYQPTCRLILCSKFRTVAKVTISCPGEYTLSVSHMMRSLYMSHTFPGPDSSNNNTCNVRIYHLQTDNLSPTALSSQLFNALMLYTDCYCDPHILK